MSSEPKPLPRSPCNPWPRRHLFLGAAWCLLGIVATCGSLSLAKSNGTYVVAWGAVLGGGAEFFYGVWQCRAKRIP